MKLQKWITINSRGSARITKGRPALDADEIAMMLDISLPDALFRKPRLEARIDIPEEAAQAEVITSEVVGNVQEAIESATGLTVVVNVVKEEE